ncbi:MAG: DNA polymerase ligase N-terminal domain-containing protein [Planctomycetota bacterium]
MSSPEHSDPPQVFTGRFVLLRHVLPAHSPRSSHWDLLLEFGAVLCAWELPCPLTATHDEDSRAAGPMRRLADHRVSYLDYEGPISGDRGHVTRVATGFHRTYIDGLRTNAPSQAGWIIELTGVASNLHTDGTTSPLPGQFAGRLSIEPSATIADKEVEWNWQWHPVSFA